MIAFKEQNHYHLQEVIDKYERQLHEKTANELQNQTMMKSEIANILQRVQVRPLGSYF
jgi:maltodextrin utilization protein YvdJ